MRFAVSEADLEVCESGLGVRLPSDLRELYLATNGVWDEPGQWFVIWRLEDVAKRNRLASEAEVAGRSEWIGFGDDGTGSPFCVDRLGGGAVYIWSSIDQRTTWLGAGVSEFWVSWVAGSLPAH